MNDFGVNLTPNIDCIREYYYKKILYLYKRFFLLKTLFRSSAGEQNIYHCTVNIRIGQG